MTFDGRQIRMNWLERAWANVAPRSALLHLAAKKRLAIEFGYNDHPERRGTPPPLSRTASETWEKQRDRLKAMADAREQAAYTWIGGVVGRLANYVCGELTCKSSTGDPSVDAVYDEYLHNWAGDEEDEDGFNPCDATGRHRLIKLCQIGLGAMTVDGDYGYQWIPGESGPDGRMRPPALLGIDADRLGSPYEATQSETYIGGITIDPELGRTLSYRVFRRSRTGQYTHPREIPPANFFHIWDPSRGDEYRGRTHLLPALNILRDLRETEEAESIAIKTQSQWAALVGTKTPFSDKSIEYWTGKTREGVPTIEAQWGKILRLGEGETIAPFQPSQRPTGSFLAFEQLRIRQVAISLQLSYGFVWDLATLGGATARVEVKGDARRIAWLRRLLVDRLLRRVRRLVLAHGIAFDGLPAHPQLGRCKWHFGQDIIVDAGYEVQNDLALLQAGLTDPDTVATKYNNGEDFAGVIAAKAGAFNRTRDIASESGTTIEILAGGLWPDATNQIAARETDPAETQPEPGTVAALGDKGAAQLLEILEKVATGVLDRESALQTLVTIWQVPVEKAEAILPERVRKAAGTPSGVTE